MAQVKSARTNEVYQAANLIQRELVPYDWQPPHTMKGKPATYPLKEVQGIHRRRLIDGSEYLLSTQWWTGLDQAGNPQSIAMNEKEWFDDVLPIYKLKSENPRDRDSKVIRESYHIEHRPTYTLPFTSENVDDLYKQRYGKCSFTVKDDMKGEVVVTVDQLDTFKLPMDEIWEIRRRALAGDRITEQSSIKVQIFKLLK